MSIYLVLTVAALTVVRCDGEPKQTNLIDIFVLIMIFHIYVAMCDVLCV